MCYAATVKQQPLCSLAIALFGIISSVFWFFYYRASIYWIWFWENRCREVNDKIVSLFGFPFDIFAGHPVGSDERPAPLKFAGRRISWIPVHSVLRLAQLIFCFMWIILLITAAYIAYKVSAEAVQSIN